MRGADIGRHSPKHEELEVRYGVLGKGNRRSGDRGQAGRPRPRGEDGIACRREREGGLDLLGDHAQPQFVSEGDQRRDHAAHLSSRLVAQVAIELQCVDQQLAELSERGEARPEVVERDARPLPADRAEPDAPCRLPIGRRLTTLSPVDGAATR